VLLLAVLLAQPAGALPRHAGASASGGAAWQDYRPQLAPHAGVSMDQAIQMAERQSGARVVRASVGEDNGRRVYILRLVAPDGRVWTVRVDAASGAMM
jgi:uncharacterized membrane protein YkoI